MTHRGVTLLAVLGLLGVCFATWTTVVQIPVTGAIAVVGFGATLALAIATLVVGEERLVWVDRALLLLGLVVLAGWAASNIYNRPGYGTDEAAYTQYAATLLLHGHDPYGANLISALSAFRVPVQYATYLLGGGIVHTFGYPSLSLLVVAVFIPLTGGVQSVIVADVVALALTAVVTYLALPRAWKSAAVLVTIGLPVLFGFSVSGVNAVMMGLPLVVVAWRWTETGVAGRLGAAGALRATCLGLAVATQPLAWFIAPFVVLGTWRLRRAELGPSPARGVLGRFVGIAIGTFVVLNAPFIAWGPKAWMAGVTSTLTQHAIPYGQGLIDVSLFFGRGAGSLELFTLAGMLVYAGLLVAFLVRFDRLGRAAFVFGSVALFFTTRSLAEYFMVLVAVWAVSSLTTSSASFAAIPRLLPSLRSPRWLAAVLAPALVVVVAALTTPPPLSIKVVGLRTNGQLESVWRVRAVVVNHESRTLRPHFEANYVGQATSFFHILRGPHVLDPGQRATYVLAAPNRGSMPGVSSPFTLVATTARPATLSVSSRFVPQTYSADLEPSYLNTIVRPGQRVVFHVVLRSPFGAYVHKAGVRVALGQVIYGQDGLVLSQARINGAPEGRTPVYAVTNRQGRATFVVRDNQPQAQPLYFQAWVATHFPGGYSGIVSVLWKRH